MTYFAEALTGRVCTVINDSFVPGATLSNGDTTVKDNGSLGRAWRAEDTGAGLAAAFLPQWGVSDWTFNVYVTGTGNYNPSGFDSYRAWSLCDNAYDNSPLYIRSGNSNQLLRLNIDGLLEFDLVRGFNTVRLQSSNLAGGVYQVFRAGRSIMAPTAHGVASAPSRTTPTKMQLGGRFQTNDYGMLNEQVVAKLWTAHRYLTIAEIREIQQAMSFV